MPTPSSHHAGDGTGTPRRTESSMTIELAQIRPSTVKGIGCAVHETCPHTHPGG
jgi:hypothetical protein